MIKPTLRSAVWWFSVPVWVVSLISPMLPLRIFFDPIFATLDWGLSVVGLGILVWHMVGSRRYVAVWSEGLSFRSQAFRRRSRAHECAMAHSPSAVINPGGAVDLDLWE